MRKGRHRLVSFFLSLICRIGALASGRTFSQDFCPSVLSFLHMHRHAAISVRWQQNSVSANRSSHVVLRIAKLFLHGKLLKIYRDVSRIAKIIMNQDLSRSSQHVLAQIGVKLEVWAESGMSHSWVVTSNHQQCKEH